MPEESIAHRKPFGIIYCLRNKVNGKEYIGQTTCTLNHRIAQHARDAKCSCRRLANAIKHYGIGEFAASQLAVAYSRAELDDLEKWFIAERGTISPCGYNLTTGGSIHAVGQASSETRDIQRIRRSSPQERQEFSERMRKWWANPENKAKRHESQRASWTAEMRMAAAERLKARRAAEPDKYRVTHTEESNRKRADKLRGHRYWGKPHSAETRARMSADRKGKKHKPYSEETKRKLSIAAKARPPASQDTRTRMSESRRGKPQPWRRGVPLSEQTKRKISERFSGQGNPNSATNRRARRGKSPEQLCLW